MSPITKQEQQEILDHLKNRYNIDFTYYNEPFVRNQIRHWMQSVKISGISAYLELLHREKGQTERLFSSLTNATSEFFRGPLTFELLGARIIPDLLDTAVGYGARSSFRAWSCCCACGEEPYSLVILLTEILGIDSPFMIFATDINPAFLQNARNGVYSGSSLENVKYGLLEKYFQLKSPGIFSLRPALREKLHFSLYDLFSRLETPAESIYGSFDLIFCRNVLIYIHPRHHPFILNKLYRALRPGGYLILGESETVPPGLGFDLKVYPGFSHIFRKTD